MPQQLTLGDLLFRLGYENEDAFVRDLEKTLGKAEGRAGEAGQKTGKRFSDQFKGAFSGAAIGAFLGNVFLQVGAQVLSATREFVRSIRERGEAIEAENIKIRTVFGETEGSIRQWAQSVRGSMGLSSQEVTTLAANVQDLLVPMGFARGEATRMTQDTLNLAAALSQWTNGTKSADEVTQILTRAFTGERESLKSLGISISEADIQQRLLAKGQKELTGQALEQARAQATLELITEKSTDAQQAFAENTDSAARKLAEQKSRINEARDTLALRLQPAWNAFTTGTMRAAADVLEGVTGIIDRLSGRAGSLEAYRERTLAAKEATEQLKEVTDENGLRMALINLAETLSGPAKDGMITFANFTIPAIIAQEGFQAALDASMRKMAEFQMASNNTRLQTLDTQRLQLESDIAGLERNIANGVMGIAPHGTEPGVLFPDVLEQRKYELDQLNQEIDGIVEQQTELLGAVVEFNEGLISAEEMAERVRVALAQAAAGVTPGGGGGTADGGGGSASGGSSSGASKAETPEQAAARWERELRQRLSIAQEMFAQEASEANRQLVETQFGTLLDWLGRQQAQLEEGGDAWTDYQEKIVKAVGELESFRDKSQSLAIPAPKVTVEAGEPVNIVPGLMQWNPKTQRMEQVAPDTRVSVTPKVTIPQPKIDVDAGESVPVVPGLMLWNPKTQRMEPVGPEVTATAGPKIRIPRPEITVDAGEEIPIVPGLLVWNPRTQQMEQIGPPVAAALTSEYEQLRRTALGDTTAFVELQRRLGRATREEVVAALEEQRAALEQLLGSVDEASEDYAIWGRVLANVLEKLERINDEGKMTIPVPKVTAEVTDEGQAYLREKRQLESDLEGIALSFPRAIYQGIKQGDIGEALKGALGSATDFFVERMIQGILGPIAENLAKTASQNLFSQGAGGAMTMNPAGLILGGGLLLATLLFSGRDRQREERERSSRSERASGAPGITYNLSATVNVDAGRDFSDPAFYAKWRNETEALVIGLLHKTKKEQS